MKESPELDTLRKALAAPSGDLAAENQTALAIDATTKILDAIESGTCSLGDWEMRCLAGAITNLRGNKASLARSNARKALWPDENRRNSEVVRMPVRPGMTTVDGLRRELAAAKAMVEARASRA